MAKTINSNHSPSPIALISIQIIHHRHLYLKGGAQTCLLLWFPFNRPVFRALDAPHLPPPAPLLCRGSPSRSCRPKRFHSSGVRSRATSLRLRPAENICLGGILGVQKRNQWDTNVFGGAPRFQTDPFGCVSKGTSGGWFLGHPLQSRKRNPI